MAIAFIGKITAAAIMCAALFVSPAFSDETLDSAAFQKIIKNQMSAFATDDAKTAFSFATGALQQRFRSPEFFMEMVRQGYQPVYKPQSVTFGRSKVTRFGPTQEVFVTGPKGKDWIALYSFEKQEDGTWRISGCYLTESEGIAA